MTTKNDFDAKTDKLLRLFDTIRNGTEQEFIEQLSKLSKDEIDISGKDMGGNSIIFDVITRGYRKALDLVLTYDPRLDIIDTEGYSLLYYPIKQNAIDIIETLLDANDISIGSSLVDIQDKNKNVPLFYAIKFNNTEVLKILLQRGANPNYRNEAHITTLHMAVIRGHQDMVKLLIQHRVAVNSRSEDGSTALHYSCNFRRYEISKILLENGADPSLIEFPYEFSPIFYAVEQNDIPLTELLITYKANPNHQDYIGNTVLIYAIKNKYHEMLDLLLSGYPIGRRSTTTFSEDINEQVISQCIDPTIVNIDGLTVGHMLVYFYEMTHDQFLRKILPYSNLNYQDNKGNTVLLLLTQREIWQQFEEILRKKKLNIFIRNNKNQTAFDFGRNQLFLDMIAASYQNYLRMFPDQWVEKWQNECSNKTDCKGMILEQIVNHKTSVPVKRDKKTVVIDAGSIVQFSTFTGSVLDVVSGFRYLTNKYPESTSVFTDYSSSETVYMKQLGIVENKHQVVMSIEIRWVYQKMFLPKNFEKSIAAIFSQNYKYIIIPIGIVLSNGSHSNCLIYHIERDVLERFEPHGSGYPNKLNYNPDLLDSVLFKLWNNIVSNIRQKSIKIGYFTPSSYLPKIGFQIFEGSEINANKNIGDPNGFCSLWCIFYLDYRLRYIDTPPQKLVRRLIKYLNVNQLSFRTTIRNYSKKITDFRDDHLQKIGFNINDYLNNRLTSKDLQRLSVSLMSNK